MVEAIKVLIVCLLCRPGLPQYVPAINALLCTIVLCAYTAHSFSNHRLSLLLTVKYRLRCPVEQTHPRTFKTCVIMSLVYPRQTSGAVITDLLFLLS